MGTRAPNADTAKVFHSPIVTRVSSLLAFYPAEDYHEDYATVHPNNPYIVYNDAPKVLELQQEFAELYAAKPVHSRAVREFGSWLERVRVRTQNGPNFVNVAARCSTGNESDQWVRCYGALQRAHFPGSSPVRSAIHEDSP